MSFKDFLETHVCYRTLVESLPASGSAHQLRLLTLYESGRMPHTFWYARQMRKLEWLTRWFRVVYDSRKPIPDCGCLGTCATCIENGGF